jgi:glycosyltransferase involved in cell wall biosynthesis
MKGTAHPKILILYTELAGYTVASLEAILQTESEMHLVHWPVNTEAPFEFRFSTKAKIYDRSSLDEKSLLKLADEIAPDLILCSGWNDKAYLAICKSWFKRIPVVLAMDNKWNGGAKQQLARLISGFTILKTFTHCWVPGEQQKIYALKLGFTADKIRTGFYTCDTSHFNAIYQVQREAKQNSFPHVFIYAGRYYDFKGLDELWRAFIEMKNQTSNDWKLVCLGTGDKTPIVHPDIEHKGFVQPRQMAEVMSHAGVFILPSRIEPWGVVVQEFAVAGFPLLLSEAVGAKEAFLENGINGFSFPPNSELDLCSELKRITALSDQKLVEMGEKSHALGMKNTPELWANTLLSFMIKS